MKLFVSLFLFLFMSLTAGCKAEQPDNESGNLPPTGSELEKLSLAILQTHCASCHDANSANLGNINYIMDIDIMKNNGLIIAGNPGSSLIYTEITSDTMPTAYNLNTSDKETIRDWITKLGESNGGPPVNSVFYSDISPIIQAQCVSCHGASNNIDLTTYESTLLSVWPGSPEASLLYDSIVSGRMPKNSSTVSLSDQQLIYDWIKQGAQ